MPKTKKNISPGSQHSEPGPQIHIYSLISPALLSLLRLQVPRW